MGKPCLALAVGLLASAAGAAEGTEHLGRTLGEWRSDLDSETQIDRLLAARSIGEMAVAKIEDADKALLEILTHSDSAVRYWAAVAAALLERPPDEAFAILRAMLADDEAPENRIQAALALIRAGDRIDSLATLAEMLKHPNRGVRLQAAHAADAIGDRARALAEPLREAVGDDFDYVQRVARHALWTLGERPCPYRTCD